MNFLVASSLRNNLRRLIATATAVALSVAFMVATLLIMGTYNTALSNSVTEQMKNSDVWLGFDDSLPDNANEVLAQTADRIRERPDVQAADVQRFATGEVRHDSRRANAQIQAMPSEPLRWATLAEGAWPQSPDEAVLNKSAADSLQVSVGDSVRLDDKNSVRVAGITSQEDQMMSMGFAEISVMPELLDRLEAQKYATGILVRSTAHDGTSNTTPDQLAQQIKDQTQGTPDITVRTRDEQAQHQIADLSGNTATLTAMLGVFVAISMIVAGYVIANTFQVLVAQRTKELALLRCIGADKRQVHGLILGEAGITASVAALVGCLLGVVATVIFAQFMSMMSALTISPLALIAGFVVGVVVTVACALGASKRATRVHPVEALRPLEAVASDKLPLGRTIVGSALTLLGAAGLIYGATSGMAVAIAGGFICGMGVLLAATTLLPRLVSLVGRALSRVSLPVELAAANSMKNPLRTAATGISMLIGVAVLVLMATGIHSVQESLISQINQERPFDLMVATSNPAGFSPQELEQIKNNPKVTASADSQSAQVTVTTSDGQEHPVKAETADSSQLSEVFYTKGDTLFPQSGVGMVGTITENKSPITIQGDAGSIVASADVSDKGTPDQMRMSKDDFAKVTRNTVTDTVYLRLTPGLSADEVQQVTSDLSALNDSYNVGGGAQDRAYYTKILNIMLMVVLALLAITLIIAFVGIGNTTALSVLERRRESALLRAVGLERRQLVTTIVVEAMLTAVVAAVCGCALGIFASWSGLNALEHTADKLELDLYIPWLQVALIIAGAGTAGVLAALLPAMGASRRPPVQDLAAE